VTVVVLALVALAALTLPGFREQLVLSTSHRPQPYVELYFARTPAGTQAVCTSRGGSVRVRFAVTSHLGEERRLDYDVTVGGRSKAGSTRVPPGRTAEVTRSFARPPGRGYVVSVRLPDVDQQLRAHCGELGS
jgi:hypothetical protein